MFALSHVCWLIAYPLVGQLGARSGMSAAFGAMAILAGVGVVVALIVWPSQDPAELPHDHDDLPDDHPHLQNEHGGKAGHTYVIDDLHRHWPRQRSGIGHSACRGSPDKRREMTVGAIGHYAVPCPLAKR